MIREHDHDPTVPKPVLYMAAGMCLFTLAISGVSSYQKHQVQASRDQDIAAMIAAGESRTRRIVFEDQTDGSIAVLDGTDRQKFTEVEPGEDSFVRGVLRGFARERKAHGVGRQPSFELTYTEAGILILYDPETGRDVVLNAFGPDNARAFARLMFAKAEGAS